MIIRQRTCTERHFVSRDGEQLFYLHWPATGMRRVAVMLLHRGHEHSERAAHIVDELDLPDFDFFAWDARGHGMSAGASGQSARVGTSVRNVRSKPLTHDRARQASYDSHPLITRAISVNTLLGLHDAARRFVLERPAQP